MGHHAPLTALFPEMNLPLIANEATRVQCVMQCIEDLPVSIITSNAMVRFDRHNVNLLTSLPLILTCTQYRHGKATKVAMSDSGGSTAIRSLSVSPHDRRDGCSKRVKTPSATKP